MPPLGRRDFLRATLIGSSSLVVGCEPRPLGPGGAPGVITAGGARPTLPYGVQSGDVTASRAVIWSRSDRPSRMVVEWSTQANFGTVNRAFGPLATPERDFTAAVDLDGLPANSPIYYRVIFEDTDRGSARSEPAYGSFRTALADRGDRGDIRFVWGGDVVGQGWGIDVARGGMTIFETMRRAQPDFLVHVGDMIYADNPLKGEVRLHDGSIWKNWVTPAKAKVAETLDEFRGNFAYNLLDQNLRRFNAEVPSLVMWDDHETHDNWWPGEVLDWDPRYTVEKRVDVLSARARQAMFEYTPIRWDGRDARVYRSIRRGPSLEVILLDERSYRGPNSENRQAVMGPETAFLGAEQLRWLKQTLASSTATWKVIGTDMPLSLVVGDGLRQHKSWFEAWSNGEGPPLGRELELADLLRFIRAQRIKNVVWLTADVHYAAAIEHDPSRAEFREFDPFWQFVAGPFHASTLGPNALDPTFGPRVVYQSPRPGPTLRAPSDGGQYFGQVRIDGKTEVMTVSLHDLRGSELYAVELRPER
ncbi:MAG: alkaline phosphatase D family protein [Byssovorax sp.]